MMMKKVLIVSVAGMIEPHDRERLEDLCEVDYHECDHIDQETLAELCTGYDYLMLNYDVIKNIDKTFYEHKAVKALDAISFDMTGMDRANPQDALEENVLLMNVPRYSTDSVAEHILGEILLHSRQIHLTYTDQLQGDEPVSRKGINLKGKTLGVVGLGHIGTRLSELAHGIGMHVAARNRTTKNVSHVTQVQSLLDLSMRSDVIAICLKTVEGTDATINIIDEEFLGAAKQDAIIINLANKSLVDHDALYGAMKEGKFMGYSVSRNQSMLDHSIASLGNVHLSAPNAWFSDESLNTLKSVRVDNVITHINGSVQNQVRE